MQETDIKIKKQRVSSIASDINISKDDLLDYLKSINITASINTNLEPEIVEKVYKKFEKDYDKKSKTLIKVIKFTEEHHLNLSETEKIKQEQEEERRIAELEIKKKEEEEQLRGRIIAENIKKEEEKKKQEEKAYAERDKIIKVEKEKEKAKKIEKKAASDKLKGISAKPAASDERNKAPLRIFKATERKFVKPDVPLSSDTKKDTPAEQTKDPSREKTPVTGQFRKPDDRVRSRPHDKNRPKPSSEKITIKDIKDGRKKTFVPNDKNKPPVSKVPGKTYTQAEVPARIIEDRRIKDRKDKDKKKHETEQERRRRIKLEKGHRAKDATQKEIDEAIRETFAKIDEDSSSARSIARKRKRKERIEEEKKILELKESTKHILKVNEFISTSELANLMGNDANEIIKNCLKLGIMVSINQRLDKDIIELIAGDFGYTIEFLKEYEEETLEDTPDEAGSLEERAPVVTVMGHVDHGKTSLLDYLRKANVVAGEAGGITQHIGAYKVKLDNGKEITFLDTPGHEAFTAMRARGGQAADIVVLVVAADDSVMPQTIEAISHARAANVPIVIAINKVDKPESNPERIKQQLSEKDILVEEWGGKYQSVEISAKHGKNIDQLLEKILIESELLELKANPNKDARGVVLEAKLDKGKGPIATVLVQKGTLKIGDSFLAGMYSGKVKAMFDVRDHKMDEAKPSTPVVVLGFDGVPQAGDSFVVLDSEKDTKSISLKRQQLKREQDFRQVKFVTLDDISKQIQEGKQVELKIILKADTDGSAEALKDSLHKLTTGETRVSVIHKAVGAISESDILLAEASGAIVIGFNVRPNLNARKLAEKNNIDVRLYNIIYNLVDEVKHALEGMLAPDISEEITCTIEVRQTFKVPKLGLIAGCYILDGKVNRNNKVRLLRDGFVIFDGGISSLKRIKDDVREVESGYECGIGLENFNDVKVGDIIEGYKIVETKRKLVTP